MTTGRSPALACLALTSVVAIAGTAPKGSGDAATARTSSVEPEKLRVKVVRTFPHDAGAFTQGLVLRGGVVYESTGLYGHSSVRKVDLATGMIQAAVPLDRSFFGEGLADVDGRLYQLTWREGHAIVWNAATLNVERQFRYEGEGWGLCFDGRHLIMSDGSDQLTLRDPRTFVEVGRLHVRSRGEPVMKLNELECVGRDVYANVWEEPSIVRIDGRTGRVTAWIDARGLLRPEEAKKADVLNGIAYLPDSGHFLLTGKLWPHLFEVEFEAVAGAAP